MEKFKQIGVLILGWTILALGVLGLFLPFLQGILFIMIGLAILSARSEMVKRFLKHLEERHPHYHQHMEKWRGRIKHWFKKE